MGHDLRSRGHPNTTGSRKCCLVGSILCRRDSPRVWSAISGLELIPAMRGHSGGVWSVAFSADGYRIVSGSCDGTVRVWDLASRAELLPPLRGHNNPVMSVAFSPDGTRIISGSHRNIRIWDALSGHQISSDNPSFPSFSREIRDGWIIDATNKKFCKIPSVIDNKSWLLEKLTVKYWFSTFHLHLSGTLRQDEDCGVEPHIERL